jgi:protein-L-isoaspartate(D-aspartate) O-methyltransferase
VDDLRQQRDRMVDEQIAARGIRDQRVLDAMRAVPRHLFVPEGHRNEAYQDRPVPIGEAQTISQPYMVAIMTAALEIQPHHRILEIGTGSGYQTAVLARLTDAGVISIERHAALAQRAETVLREIGVRVRVLIGDGTQGWAADAPYDRPGHGRGAGSSPGASRSTRRWRTAGNPGRFRRASTRHRGRPPRG